MYIVTSPAANTNLTTLDALKTELIITTGDEDDYLAAQIIRVSSKICTYLDIPAASDGSRTLGQQGVAETFRFAGLRRVDRTHHGSLSLSRYPVVSISSVVEDGTTLDTTEYEIDGATGSLVRLSTDGVRREWWGVTSVIVNYTGGWLMPDDAGRTLPQDIETAAIELVKVARFSRTRDSSLKTESLIQREYIYEVFAPSELVDGMPANIAMLLAPYRNLSV